MLSNKLTLEELVKCKKFNTKDSQLDDEFKTLHKRLTQLWNWEDYHWQSVRSKLEIKIRGKTALPRGMALPYGMAEDIHSKDNLREFIVLIYLDARIILCHFQNVNRALYLENKANIPNSTKLESILLSRNTREDLKTENVVKIADDITPFMLKHHIDNNIPIYCTIFGKLYDIFYKTGKEGLAFERIQYLFETVKINTGIDIKPFQDSYFLEERVKHDLMLNGIKSLENDNRLIGFMDSMDNNFTICIFNNITKHKASESRTMSNKGDIPAILVENSTEMQRIFLASVEANEKTSFMFSGDIGSILEYGISIMNQEEDLVSDKEVSDSEEDIEMREDIMKEMLERIKDLEVAITRLENLVRQILTKEVLQVK